MGRVPEHPFLKLVDQGPSAQSGPLIDAVRADDAFGRELAAVALRNGSTAVTYTAVTYSVVEPQAPEVPPPEENGAEKRSVQRMRTRLRSGKVLDRRNRFLTECVLHDRSPRGSRVRLHGNVALPDAIRFYDDEQHEIVEATVVWRRGSEVGILLDGAVSPDAIRPADLARLAGKYYAVPPLELVTSR